MMSLINNIFEDIGKMLDYHGKLAERDGSEYGDLIVTDITCAIGALKQKYLEASNDL